MARRYWPSRYAAVGGKCRHKATIANQSATAPLTHQSNVVARKSGVFRAVAASKQARHQAITGEISRESTILIGAIDVVNSIIETLSIADAVLCLEHREHLAA